MKRKLLSLAMLMVLAYASHAQGVPNGNFEMWDVNVLFEEPEGYNSSNMQTYFEAMTVGVTKSTDAHSGDYALKLENKAAMGDTLFGFAVTGMPDEDFSGGFPYSEVPDSFKAYMKYNLTNSDSGLILLLFKRQGQIIGMEFLTVYGQVNSWTEHVFPVKPFFGKPDSVVLGFASGNPENESVEISADNWMMVDDISFVGATAPIPNNGFENWKEFKTEEAKFWSSLNPILMMFNLPKSVSQTSDAYAGDYAMSIKTVNLDLGFGGYKMGVATTGSIQEEMSGGFAMQNKPDSVSFYYKYDNSNGTQDAAMFNLYFSKWNATNAQTEAQDSLMMFLQAASDYTRVSKALDLSSVEIDSANITFSSSNMLMQSLAGEGNVLIVDEINFYYAGVGIPLDNHVELNAFPNPATRSLRVEFYVTEAYPEMQLSIYDINGKLVRSHKETQLREGNNIIEIDVEELPAGQYIYSIGRTGEKGFTSKFIKK